jgi:hypothetical protein
MRNMIRWLGRMKPEGRHLYLDRKRTEAQAGLGFDLAEQEGVP